MCTIATLTNGRAIDRAHSRAIDRAHSRADSRAIDRAHGKAVDRAHGRAVDKEVCREVQQGSLLFISATLEHLFRKTVTPNNEVHLKQT